MYGRNLRLREATSQAIHWWFGEAQSTLSDAGTRLFCINHAPGLRVPVHCTQNSLSPKWVQSWPHALATTSKKTDQLCWLSLQGAWSMNSIERSSVGCHFQSSLVPPLAFLLILSISESFRSFSIPSLY